MYKNVFDNHLNNQKTFTAYMFWGQSDFLVEDYALRVATNLANGEDIQKVYFDEYNYDTCKDYLSQSSLFSSSNILLIKTTKKIPKKEVDSLIKSCTLNQDSHAIFSCMGGADFKTMAKFFTTKTNSVEVRFFTPNMGEAIEILNQEATISNVKFTQGALAHLYEMHEKNLSLCISDIKKLSILDEEISTKIIINQCFGMGTVSLDDMLIKLFSHQPYNSDLYKLLEEGTNEIYLVNQITTFVQQLFLINTYLELYDSLNIVEIWGYPLPKNIANQRVNIAVKFTIEQFNMMLSYLLNLELELKSPKISNANAYVQASLRKFSVIFR